MGRVALAMNDLVDLAVDEMDSVNTLQDVQAQLLEPQKQVKTLISREEIIRGIYMGLGRSLVDPVLQRLALLICPKYDWAQRSLALKIALVGAKEVGRDPACLEDQKLGGSWAFHRR